MTTNLFSCQSWWLKNVNLLHDMHQKIIPDSFYGSFWNIFLKCDDSNRGYREIIDWMSLVLNLTLLMIPLGTYFHGKVSWFILGLNSHFSMSTSRMSFSKKRLLTLSATRWRFYQFSITLNPNLTKSYTLCLKIILNARKMKPS